MPHDDRTKRNGKVSFFKQFIKNPRQIGSIIPSSRFLERRIVDTAGVETADTIVELGPGNGGTTRAILSEMKQDAKLLSIEVNPRLYALVSRISDNRHISHLGSAQGLKEILSMYGLEAPDVIISGIPFSTMNQILGSAIIENISATLAPGGRFVAYQVSKRVASLSQPYMGPGRLEVEFLNIPPVRVYCWQKNGAAFLPPPN